MKNFLFVVSILLFPAILQAQSSLQGEITAKTITAAGNPYIIEKDLIIPVGKEVFIEAGCVFLFNPFTGIQVKGKLVVEGEPDNPVVFTSINDNDFNPDSPQLANPFDWNGILVGRESEGAFMKHFKLRYSVYGIKGQTPSIMIQNGKLRQNGQFHFTINDKIQYVQDGIPFSYGVDKFDDDDITGWGRGTKDTPPKGKERGRSGRESKQKKIFRFATLGVGIAGLGASAVYGVLAYKSNKEWFEMEDLDPQKTKDSDAFDKKGEERNRRIIGSVLSGTVGLLGMTGFTLTFVF
ncbi:MAG: hypothetical protein GF401_20140 [Chitinivibrionales bacterium]|nr:hypothetical protein [Chitinivibrionales bacterium]